MKVKELFDVAEAAKERACVLVAVEFVERAQLVVAVVDDVGLDGVDDELREAIQSIRDLAQETRDYPGFAEWVEDKVGSLE